MYNSGIMPRRSARLAAKPRPNYRKMAGLRPVAQKKTITALVKRVIGGTEEKKFIASSTGWTGFNSSINSTAEWYNCVPSITQGIQSYQRIGNMIKPKVLDMNWWIGFNAGVSRSCDDWVVLYVFKCKNLRSFGDMTARGDPNAFLETGSVAGNVAFTGYANQLSLPVNNEAFTLVAQRKIHMQKGVGLLNNDLSEGYAGNGNVSAKHVRIQLKNLPNLRYDGSAEIDPDNYGLCWALGYAHTDSAIPDYVNQDIVVSTQHKMYYTDA